MTDLREGDRIELVRFWLDEGVRIWPIFDAAGKPVNEWRVVRVDGQRDEDVTELYRHESSHECQTRYPEATFSINDNENVLPGTKGTITHATSVQVSVAWDDGSRLGLTERDQVRKL